MDQYTATLDLLRRLPPTKVERNVDILCQLVPDLASDLLLEIDQPLRIAQDPADGREYLCSEYNRDSDSYRCVPPWRTRKNNRRADRYPRDRSPWTNTYNPPLPDGALPSKKLRELEIAMNDAFDTYRDMSGPFPFPFGPPRASLMGILTFAGTMKEVSHPSTYGTKKTEDSRA